MRRSRARALFVLLAAASATGGCAGTPAALSPAMPARAVAAAPECATADARISFDFEGASPARCVIEGRRSFSVVISPEHAPPINPSPWYAMRYQAAPGAPVTLTLRYLEGWHRYSPKLTKDGSTSEVKAEAFDKGRSARVTLPPGEGVLSAQPIVAAERYQAFAARLARDFGARRLTIGQSWDRRPIEAIGLGESSAPRLIVLLGRQHPPEVTGAYAMEPFVERLAAMLRDQPALARRYQVLAIPLLNPDGVALGHWRANRGGVDLNRDWGPFTQPETAAVRDLLVALRTSVRPVLMIDFHSTRRSLFYVQGEEATPAQARFIAGWLGGKESAFPGYPFTIERRNANPGSGTAKNWFHATYAIPALTYEVGDDVDPAATADAATELATALFPLIDALP